MAKLYFRYGAVGSAKTLNLIAVAHNYIAQVSPKPMPYVHIYFIWIVLKPRYLYVQ
jgi:hypothetical protein